MNSRTIPFFEADFEQVSLPLHDSIGADRLTILEQVGSTQFAKVFRAIDLNTSAEVAAKVIECKPEALSWRRAAEKIRREVKAWVRAKDQSRHIMSLNDVIVHEVKTPSQHFVAFVLIMPFSKHGDLKKYILKDKVAWQQLPLTSLRRFLLHLAQSIGALHKESLIHKDIKSNNILLFPGDDFDSMHSSLEPLLADFGIAQESHDGTRGREGTPEYMAPEAFADQSVLTTASDIYSLGVLFYEAITTQLPYRATGLSFTERFSAYESLHKAGAIDYNPVKTRCGEEMENLVKDMLHLNPAKRPSIRAVIEEINQQLMLGQYGDFVTATTSSTIPGDVFRWNPFVHVRMLERLSYYFIKGANNNTDKDEICGKLSKAGVKGFSFYQVVGGIDYILRVWERETGNSSTIAEVVNDFIKRQQGATVSRFVVGDFHSISSRLSIAFKRFEREALPKLIFEALSEDREQTYQNLHELGLVAGRMGMDTARETHPLRVFTAYKIDDPQTNMKVYAREIFDTVIQFAEKGDVASISTYFGSGTYNVLVKMRLKRFEDYEEIWKSCIESVRENISQTVVIKPETFVELTRISLVESDDGAIWNEVDRYRRDARLIWPGNARR